jgi:hypothetical protein
MAETPKRVTPKSEKAAVITPHRLVPEAAIDPASLMSVTFHVALVCLFAILAPPTTIGKDDTETKGGELTTVREDEPERPKFDNPEENPEAIRSGEAINYENPRKGPVSIPGAPSPEEQFGMSNGDDRPPFNVLPPVGFSSYLGQGAPTEGKVGNAERSVGTPGSYTIGVRPKHAGSFVGRGTASREYALATKDASPPSEAAVARGLRWLARVQSADGRWKLDGNFPDKGNPNDAAGTALGVLPFLAAGFTHRPAKDNAYDKPIDKAIKYLVSIQDRKTGAFARDMYAHGICTIAICEAFGLSQDYALKRPAQNAINYIVSAQHPGGGWRYQPGQAGDTSVTGWQVMALKSGMMAGLEVPPGSLRKAQAYLDACVEPATEGYGYQGPTPTPTMSAVSLLCRQYLQGWGPQNLRMIKGIDNYIKPNSPKPDRKDIYYYYYATQVMHHFGGTDWKAWNVTMRDQLVAEQAKNEADLTTWGSWSPKGDAWGRTGGRLMQTSLSLLTLEVYYRYLPLYYRDTGAVATK